MIASSWNSLRIVMERYIFIGKIAEILSCNSEISGVVLFRLQ